MDTGFLNRTIMAGGQRRAYQVYVPATYDASRAWPLILFLHGAGERGDDGLLQTEIGLPSAIRRHPERFPALVVMPQAPAGRTWQGGPARQALAALDATIREFNVDPARIYLAGISMGGNGAWALALEHGDRFAALVVVCGFVSARPPYRAVLAGGDGPQYRQLAERIASLPVWMVHGDADPVVPVSESRRMHQALVAAGARVHYIELPGVGHNSWDAAFGSPEFADWLFARRKP